MCHPGRPRPHGASQAGSPGFEAFHRAKSSGLRFMASCSFVTRSHCDIWSSGRRLSLPYSGNEETSNQAEPSGVA